MHAMSVERANDFCTFVVAFHFSLRKLTVALYYVKRLLELRWTGHLATVTAVFNSFQYITSLFQEMATSRAHKAETRIEAS